MAQTVENAEAVVVTAPKEKVVTPVTVKDVENISEKVAQEVVDASFLSYKKAIVVAEDNDDGIIFNNLPKIEAFRDFYLHKGKTWLMCHHKHASNQGPLEAISITKGDGEEYESDGGYESCRIGDITPNSLAITYVDVPLEIGEWELFYIPAFTPFTMIRG